MEWLETHLDQTRGEGNRHPRGVHIESYDFTAKLLFEKLKPTSPVRQETTSESKKSRHNAAENSTNYVQLFVPPLYANINLWM